LASWTIVDNTADALAWVVDVGQAVQWTLGQGQAVQWTWGQGQACTGLEMEQRRSSTDTQCDRPEPRAWSLMSDHLFELLFELR
jgi:hypothetical protein